MFAILLKKCLQRFHSGIRIAVIVTPRIDEMDQIPRQRIGAAPIGHVTFLQMCGEESMLPNSSERMQAARAHRDKRSTASNCIALQVLQLVWYVASFRSSCCRRVTLR